jgi:hypothetical protein
MASLDFPPQLFKYLLQLPHCYSISHRSTTPVRFPLTEKCAKEGDLLQSLRAVLQGTPLYLEIAPDHVMQHGDSAPFHNFYR